MKPSYLILDAGEILGTIERLRGRIEDRFPGSGLSQVCGQLLEISRYARERAAWIAKPILSLRVLPGIDEPFSMDPSSPCNKLFPPHTNTHIAAGAPLSDDILKCQLKPLARLSAEVTMRLHHALAPKTNRVMVDRWLGSHHGIEGGAIAVRRPNLEPVFRAGTERLGVYHPA